MYKCVCDREGRDILVEVNSRSQVWWVLEGEGKEEAEIGSGGTVPPLEHINCRVTGYIGVDYY